MSPSRYYYWTRDTVTFACNPGYALQGPHSSTCGADFRWNPPLPQCKKGERPGGVSSAGRGESSLLCPDRKSVV